MATNGGHIETVEILVKRNAAVYETSTSKPSPLLVATQRGFTKVLSHSSFTIISFKLDPQIVELLVQHLGLERIVSKEPKPLLNIAAAFGHLSIVQLLVQFGADPLMCGERSMNALHEATLKGKMNVVQYLVKNGVEVDVHNLAGETPLHLAAKSGHVDVADYLLRHSADVHRKRKKGHTALHFAAARGDIPLARLLLNAGADIQACQFDIGTPLYTSAERGQVYMVRFLLKRGAKVDHPCTEEGNMPLHIASSMGHLAVIETLLTAGAYVQATNMSRQRPEDVIGSKKSLSVVERGLIESTFSRYKKKKIQEKKSVKTASPRNVSPRERKTVSPRHFEETVEPKSASPMKLQCIEIEPETGEDPGNEEEEEMSSVQEPSSPLGDYRESLPPNTASSDTARPRPSIIDEITARRAAEGFRLYDIEEFMSHPSQDAARIHTAQEYKKKPQTARTPRQTSFNWSRLQRHPGSVRGDYRHSVTESPKRASVVRSESKRLSRSGSMSIPQVSLSMNKSSTVTKLNASPSAERHKMSQGPSSARDHVGSVDSEVQHHHHHHNPVDGKHSSVFKRLPKAKRTGSQDSGSQTDATNIPFRRQGSIDVDAKGRPNLFVAANSGNAGLVNRLLESGVDPNVRVEEHGWTPLYAASRHGYVEVARKLLQHGARVNETINSNATALHGACAFGQVHVAQVLIDCGARTNATTKNGELPLHTAARNGYMHVVALLLATDRSVIDRKRISDGSTALHLAVEKQWAGAVKELIDWEANPGIAKADGITPLYLASIHGNKSIAQMILNSTVPFDVNIQTVENWTALHVACARSASHFP